MKVNYKTLRARCVATLKDYWNMRGGQLTKTKLGNYLFIDRGADVLAIAHLDTVQQNIGHFGVSSVVGGDTYVHSPALDDRLGVYTILDFLPTLGVKCDVLLTEGEEVGRSTGGVFQPTKKYNWMFQFDRGGTDVVMYDYETQELKDALVSHDWVFGDGIFSDISAMEHVGIKGFNFGVGYRNYHSKDAYVPMSDYYRNIKRFVSFYQEFANIKLPHSPLSPVERYALRYGAYNNKNAWYDSVRKGWDYIVGHTDDSDDDFPPLSEYHICPYCDYVIEEEDIPFFKEYGLCTYCNDYFNKEKGK